jgi:hypothetical protein
LQRAKREKLRAILLFICCCRHRKLKLKIFILNFALNFSIFALCKLLFVHNVFYTNVKFCLQETIPFYRTQLTWVLIEFSILKKIRIILTELFSNWSHCHDFDYYSLLPAKIIKWKGLFHMYSHKREYIWNEILFVC